MLSCRVTATNAEGSTVATSNAVAVSNAVALIFEGGFETGDFTNWDTVATGASVVTTPVFAGIYAAQFTNPSNGIRRTLVSGVTTLFSELMWRINRVTPATSYTTAIANCEVSGGADVFNLRANIQSNGVINLYLRNLVPTTAVDYATTFNVEPDVWHKIQIKTVINGAASSLELRWGGQTATFNNINLGTTPIAIFHILNSFNSTTAKTTFFDNVKLSTEGYPS